MSQCSPPSRQHYRDQVDRLERGGVNTIGKEHFTSLIQPCQGNRVHAEEYQGRLRCEWFIPLNPRSSTQRYADPAPRAELAIPRADEVRVGSCSARHRIPQTPVTPVSAEALMSLQNLIIQQDALHA